MQIRNLVVRLLLLTALAGSLTACAPATPPPAPTADPGIMQTQVAAAIAATQTAAVTPTLPPTLTPTATNTPQPTITNTPQPTATLGTPLPTATKQIIGDGAKFSGTAPHSGAEIEPNSFYNLEFDFINVGTTTWTGNYTLVWVGGERFTNVTSIPLNMEVPPGKKGVFVLGTFGSEEFTTHYTRWQLYNAQGLPVIGGIGEFWYNPV